MNLAVLRPQLAPVDVHGCVTAAFPPAATEDPLLVLAMSRGDDRALASLYDLHAPATLGLLRRLLGDSGEAEEILQETFLQAWRLASTYRPERSSVRSWLLMLARSRALDRLKSNRARTRREETVEGASTPRVVPAQGVERIESRERARAVRGALAELSPEQRQAVELSFFLGLSHSEIAERVGAPLGTVKSRILLGLRRLRRSLERSVEPAVSA